MTITIGPEYEQLISQLLESGGYRSPEEVIAVALEALRSEDESRLQMRSMIEKKIDRAFAQFERGEVLTPEESLAAMEEHRAAWLRANRG